MQAGGWDQSQTKYPRGRGVSKTWYSPILLPRPQIVSQRRWRSILLGVTRKCLSFVCYNTHKLNSQIGYVYNGPKPSMWSPCRDKNHKLTKVGHPELHDSGVSMHPTTISCSGATIMSPMRSETLTSSIGWVLDTLCCASLTTTAESCADPARLTARSQNIHAPLVTCQLAGWIGFRPVGRGGLGRTPFQAKNGITNQAILLEWQAPSETSKLPSMISGVSGPLVNDTVYLYLDTVYMEEPLLLLKQFHCCSPQCNTNSMYY